MSDFVLHPEAYADLEQIWEYIAADNLDAADRVLNEIRNALRLIVAFPLQGHIRSDLSSRGLRFLVVREYVIAYAPQERPIAILAVLHGRRSPRVVAAILRERA
jgi:toxin ParE1/3/4